MKLEIVNDKSQYSSSKHYNLGCILYTGIGEAVIKDHDMAYQQFLMGQEHDLCQYNLGCMMYNSEGGSPGGPSKALDIFTKLGSKGHIPSMLNAAIINYELNDDRDFIPFDNLSGSSELSYDQNELCSWYLGQCYIHNGLLKEALDTLIKVTKINMVETNYLIGELYLQRNISVKAKPFFQKATAGYHQLACWRLNSRIVLNDNMVENLKTWAENGNLFWSKVYADYMKDQETFDGYMEAAEYYRALDDTDMYNVCLEKALQFTTKENIDKNTSRIGQMISFGYLPARIRYTEILFESGEFTEDLEGQLMICKADGDVISIYRLARLYESWGRKTDAVKNYQDFLSKTDDPLDAKQRIRQIQSPDKKQSESSTDEFVEVELNSDPEAPPKQKTPCEKYQELMEKAVVSDPDVVGQAMINLIDKKKPKVIFYSSYVQVLKKIGVSDKLLDQVIIQGATKGSGHCLKILGKRWLKQNENKGEEDVLESPDEDE